MTARRVLVIAAILSFFGVRLPAQSKIAQFSVLTDYSLAQFKVDGQTHYGKATFTWPEGSTHILEFPVADDGYQYIAGNGSRFLFQGWEDSADLLPDGDRPVQVIVAHSEIKSLKINLEVEHRVKVMFWKPESGSGPRTPCGPPDASPIQTLAPGIVMIGETCLSHDTEFWLPENKYNLAAYPYPGFAFTGWGIGDAGPNAFLRTLEVRSPMVVAAYFRPAKRVKFITEPLGMKVLLDRTEVPTPYALPCTEHQTLPVGSPPGIPTLCVGEVDWALDTQHVIGAPTPQMDRRGKLWVFHSFSNGATNHSIYEVKSVSTPETIVAKFVPGAQVSFVTVPGGLKLSVNGRDNWPSYNFVAAIGEKYSLAAPEMQVGRDGRMYVFRGWSNGGGASQEIIVPAEAAESGFRLTASYEILSQTVIFSDPAGTPVEIDGTPCNTPCAIDKPDGTEVLVAAPVSRSVSPAHRVEFAEWSDGGPRARTLKIAGQEPARLTAHYKTYYRLDVSSDPANGAEFVLTPPSPDSFYPNDTAVTVSVKAKEGYRFRRWKGDSDTSYEVAWLQMSVPRSVVAMLDELPAAERVAVRNAAGLTPNQEVAPGSIISIYGRALAPYLAIGRQNPLPQTMAGTTVTAGSRVLALLFISPDQINAVLPPELPEGTYTLTVRRDGLQDVSGEFKVMRNAPGLFSRVFDTTPVVMAAHEDGSPITPESPARKGETIWFYGTGFGPYDRPVPYGFNLPEAPAYALADAMELLIAGSPVRCEWAGGASGFSGTDLMKLRITDDLPSSATVELKVRINGRESNQLYLPLE